ncbi:unnamed protein product [Acanthoscelides obtectus]|uniref:DDE Tnp4 domain-containing protein n=1 Tax=Acanthoscelides obtectus TaxID=200917 RepID=A0A9P0LA66_ACAOB|nr:unnamed protein product [Acanthoscelides obtectus]CAK1627358.1 hypothetical protein AOBTE_LOCUS4549 [Acanthoscelides obtectus]
MLYTWSMSFEIFVLAERMGHFDMMVFPSKEEEWLKVAEGFNNMWQFENCLGAVDGKHIAIKQPPGSGSYYYNYKGFFSVVLFAIVNANYEFTYVSCGTNGRISDGGSLRKQIFTI